MPLSFCTPRMDTPSSPYFWSLRPRARRALDHESFDGGEFKCAKNHNLPAPSRRSGKAGTAHRGRSAESSPFRKESP